MIIINGCSNNTQDEISPADNLENSVESTGELPDESIDESTDESINESTNDVSDNTENNIDSGNEPNRIRFITGDVAKQMFESDNAVILLDVRNQDEFDEYHLEDSILIPVAELEHRLSELPDKTAEIIVFCRTGRRSALAAEILSANGYTNVFDMGSIYNWD